MKLVIIIISVLAALSTIALLTAYICFRMVFLAGKRRSLGDDEFDLPPGDEYVSFYPKMKEWIIEKRALPCERVSITSFDGLRLNGLYYELFPGGIVEILVHGYRGTSERDLSAGIERCRKLGRNVLLIDLRGASESEGKVISFGVNEHKDLLRWIDYLIEKLGREQKIILTGLSMGAATVMMAAGCRLPENVVCVLADCGFTSAKDIIRKVIKDMRLPADVFYPFVRLSAKLFGGFSLESSPPIEAVQRATVPIIFIHGGADSFIPCQMSVELYEKCASKKKLLIVDGAAHGLSYPIDPEGYINALKAFAGECGFQYFE